MTIVRVRGFKIFDDRHGHKRCYHRKTKIAIDLKKAPLGSAEFMAECARIRALTTADSKPKPGTLGLLIAAYRAHQAFTDLQPRTKSDYQAVFDYLQPIADTPLVKFDRPLIVRIRDKAAKDKGRKFANDLKARFSGVFGWGRSVATSPATRPQASKTFAGVRMRWTPTDHGPMKSETWYLPPARPISGRPSR